MVFCHSRLALNRPLWSPRSSILFPNSKDVLFPPRKSRQFSRRNWNFVTALNLCYQQLLLDCQSPINFQLISRNLEQCLAHVIQPLCSHSLVLTYSVHGPFLPLLCFSLWSLLYRVLLQRGGQPAPIFFTISYYRSNCR